MIPFLICAPALSSPGAAQPCSLLPHCYCHRFGNGVYLSGGYLRLHGMVVKIFFTIFNMSKMTQRAHAYMSHMIYYKCVVWDGWCDRCIDMEKIILCQYRHEQVWMESLQVDQYPYGWISIPQDFGNTDSNALAAASLNQSPESCLLETISELAHTVPRRRPMRANSR